MLATRESTKEFDDDLINYAGDGGWCMAENSNSMPVVEWPIQ